MCYRSCCLTNPSDNSKLQLKIIFISVQTFDHHQDASALDLVNDLMIEATNMMKMEKNFKHLMEIEEMIANIKEVQDTVAFQASQANELRRKKRQAPPSDCAGAQAQLDDIRNKIALTTEKLKNNTATASTIQKQVDTFGQRISVPATNTTSNRQFFTSYTKLLSSAQASINLLNKQLADLRAEEAKLLANAAAACAPPTTTTTSKIMK